MKISYIKYKNDRSLSKKITHGTLGFISGLFAAPYAALKSVVFYYAYLFSVFFYKPWSLALAVTLLAVPLAIVTVPYLLGYALFGMFRGFFLGFQHAIFRLSDLVLVFSVPAYAWHATYPDWAWFPRFYLDDKAAYARTFLNRRFGMYEGQNSTVLRVIDFFHSNHPIERQLAQAYFNYLKQKKEKFLATAIKGVDSWRYWNFTKRQLITGYWDYIDGNDFTYFLHETDQINLETLSCLRANGIMLDRLLSYHLFRCDEYKGLRDKKEFEKACLMILNTCSKQSLACILNSNEVTAIQEFFEPYLKHFYHETETYSTVEALKKQEHLYIFNYIFTELPLYILNERTTTVEQPLHALFKNHLNLFSESELQCCMVVLMRTYLRFFSNVPYSNELQTLYQNMLLTIALCFQNDTVDFPCNKLLHTLLTQAEEKLPATVQNLGHLVEDTSLIRQASGLPHVLVSTIVEYRGTLTHSEEERYLRKKLKFAESKSIHFYNPPAENKKHPLDPDKACISEYFSLLSPHHTSLK